ncbi:tetratricopeptide repeat protein [Xanthocytophaga flava]|uniref:tetratricopeptide repeat protein n=1 Tax=Xanthocytophaga flava TaxID=3048013 RepID=UPI0028D0A636|nr:tetratricopeptide repeat protein [Xanthocytophaga flavus]MDJ1471972.1 tetratricopeptide repeat protein [Xanthocytophaga flavus]
MELNNTQQERWEYIDAYLRNELNTEEKANFEDQLSTNSSLQEEVTSIRTASTLIRSYGQREELKEIHKKMVSLQKRNQDTSTQNIRFYLRIAAIIVFLIVAWSAIGFMSLNPNSLYSDDFSSFTSDAVRGEAGPKHPKTEYLIHTEYVNANYVRVVELYKGSKEKSLMETFLAGNAYLALNQASTAIYCFKQVLYLSAKENTYGYYQEAEYYLAWSYLRNNQLDDAIKLFDKIRRSEFHVHNGDVDSWFYWKLKLLQWKRR